MADILTPALGESVSEATVARWTKKPGEAVKKDELLVELETDKVSLEVVAPADGVLESVAAGEGDTVVPGTVLGVVAEGGKASAKPAQSAAAPAGEAQPEPQKGKAPPSSGPVPDTSAPAAGGVEVTTPAMGESVAEGVVGKWTKKAGDAVKKDEVLVEIETDKVAVEVAAPSDGVLS